MIKNIVQHLDKVIKIFRIVEADRSEHNSDLTDFDSEHDSEQTETDSELDFDQDDY